METLLSVQPRIAADKSAGSTPDDIVFQLAKDIEARLPASLVQRKDDPSTSLSVFRS